MRTLDQLGNWEEFDEENTGDGTWDLEQSRAHNAANEIFRTLGDPISLQPSGAGTNWADPLHDKAGNMTTIPSPKDPTKKLDLKYDAWNRMVEAKDDTGTVVQTNEYDGLNRRIIRDETGGSGVLTHFYYNQQWQVLEERVGTSTTADKQYVYHPHYVDAVAVRYWDEDNSATNGLETEHYYLQDANFNVTAVTDNTGAVKERYAYTPYGEVTFLDENFVARSTQESDIDNEHLYTGRRLDPETGLQLNRNRFYASHLGRWVNRDPKSYRGSPGNLYQYTVSRPVNTRDPLGLQSITPGMEGRAGKNCKCA